MHEYEEFITVNEIVFHRHPQHESRLWDFCYVSEPLQEIEGWPVFIKLYVGTRRDKDDLAWTARLYVGSWCLFVDALEYYEPEETVKKCTDRLANKDAMESVRNILHFDAGLAGQE